MIRRIIRFSAHHRILVILFVAALVGYTIYAIKNIPLDAIPDLSDTQVIVYTKWDRSPDILEEQVTYPIVTALLGAPKVKTIRGFSDFGFSYVYVIFQDGTDIYWARSRVVEYLSKIQGSLPQGVKTEIGPDATGVGWGFQYALVDKSGKHNLADLRTFQDWNLKYEIQSVPGVAEVASIGGFEKQYQVTIDPNRLQSYRISLMDVMKAIKRSNNEVGGRLIEWTGKEYMVRAKGYIKTVDDLRKVVIRSHKGTPVLLENVANISLGPQIRRGLSDLDGLGDVVGGIVIIRHGENALNVIKRVKAKLEEIKPGLPEGVEIKTTYDRSDLIQRSIDNLKEELLTEMAIVSIVILLFLWHFPSAFVPIITIPISVLLAFIPMYFFGISSNIMSLAGIAISIGVLVDGAIVEVENAYKKIEHWINEDGKKTNFHEVRLEALMEVGPSVFFSLLVITVSFLPVFTLVDQEGRLFTPLAWTKTLTLALAALLAVTLDPAIRMLFSRIEPFHIKPKWAEWLINALFVGKYYAEEKHPISKVLFKLYESPCRFVLKHPKKVIVGAILLVVSTIPIYFKLGSEFMPPLNEGTVLYMPTTLPGLSVTEARNLLIAQDRILKSFPEVDTVFGKAGRADTSTDPAPFSMMETTIQLKPEREWRTKQRWYSSWAPNFLKAVLRHIWPDRISYEELIEMMNQAIQIPGNTNAFTMPIKGRIDMLTTGVRTPIGIKIFGSDLNEIQKIGEEIEKVIKTIPGTRSVFAERVGGGYYVDFIPKREALARYGLTIEDLQSVIMSAIGGETVSTTIEGRERYSINVRYPRNLRTDIDQLERVLVTTMEGVQVPVKEVADIILSYGSSMIRDENGKLAGYVYVDIADRDIGSYVEEAKKMVELSIKLPVGYSLIWSGQYENMQRVKERLKVMVPLTIILIFALLYMNTKSAFKAGVVMLAVPFSLVGAVWLMYLLGYHISIATWVGMIALMGLDAETGVFMLLFLDLSYDEAKRRCILNNINELKDAIINGAVKRIRPKIMTVMAAGMGLMPIMWSQGTGADMMKRVAAPMVGGLFTSFILELMVYPAIYLLWRKKELK